MIHDTRNNKLTAVGCEDVRRKAKSMGLQSEKYEADSGISFENLNGFEIPDKFHLTNRT